MPAFVFDATAYAGKTLVVTEILFDYDLYDEDLDEDENEKAIILRHDSLSDRDQQVSYPEIPKEESSSIQESEPNSEIESKPESQPEKETPVKNPPTGDHARIGFYIGAMMMALAAIVLIWVLRHVNRKKKG